MGFSVAEDTNACRIRRKRGELVRRVRFARVVFLEVVLRVDGFFFALCFAAGAEAGPTEAVEDDDFALLEAAGCGSAVCALICEAHTAATNAHGTKKFLRKCLTTTMYHLDKMLMKAEYRNFIEVLLRKLF
jgi:hypothetical protein